MPVDNPFSIDAAPESDSEASRRKKLSLYGLQGLGRYANDQQSADLQEQPLYGGELSKSSQVSPEAGEPSQLATERVERAPATQESSPLLPPAERLGNVLTGEAGQYGPLTGEQRSVSLKDFFRSSGGSQNEAAQGGHQDGVEQDVGGADNGPPAGLTELGYAKTGLSAANMLDKATGSKVNNYLKQLFQTGGAAGGAAYPSGLSFGGVEATGAQFPSNLSLTGQPTEGFPMDAGDYKLGAGGEGGAASGGASALGASASVMGLVASIYGLASGAEVTPGMIINLLQNGVTTATQLVALAVEYGVIAASEATATVAALGSAAALPLGAAAALYSVYQSVGKIQTGNDKQIYGGIAQLIGGPGAGMLSDLITRTMQDQPYIRHRQDAMTALKDDINQYGTGIQTAAYSGDIRAIQKALEGPVPGVQVSLQLPDDVAKSIGIPASVGFSQLSPEQFVRFLKAYQEQGELGGRANDQWFATAVDVPYVGPGHAFLATTNALQTTASKTILAMIQQYAPLLAQLPRVTSPITEEAMQADRERTAAGQAGREREEREFNTLYQSQLRDLFNQNAAGGGGT